MKTKITSRDIKFFLLGVLFMVALDMAFNWNQSIEAFKRGYNDGLNAVESTNSNSE